MIANPQVVWKSMHTKYSFTYWFQLFAIERNGSYGNAALKLKKFFSINPLFEINLNQIIINLLVFRLTGSTTIASAFAISKERSNLQWNCPMTSRRKKSCLVLQLTLSSKVSFWFAKGITAQQRNSRALSKGNLRQCEGIKCYGNRNNHSYPFLT